jgi:hypothetical protein
MQTNAEDRQEMDIEFANVISEGNRCATLESLIERGSHDVSETAFAALRKITPTVARSGIHRKVVAIAQNATTASEVGVRYDGVQLLAELGQTDVLTAIHRNRGGCLLLIRNIAVRQRRVTDNGIQVILDCLSDSSEQFQALAGDCLIQLTRAMPSAVSHYEDTLIAYAENGSNNASSSVERCLSVLSGDNMSDKN